MVGLIVFILAVLVSAVVQPSWLGGLGQPFQEGGWGMRLILFSLFMSLWLTIDRAMTMFRASFDARGFVDRLRQQLAGGDLNGALQTCQAHRNRPLARIVEAGLSQSNRGQMEVLKAMDTAAYSEVPQIEKRTGYLALMGNVATLMGLFGTIVGLIHSFGAVGKSGDYGDKATQLAAGISEAMNCTAFGLLTGIFALVAYSVINGKTQQVIDQLNHLSLRVYRAWKANFSTSKQEAKPIKAPHPHLMTYAGLNKQHGAHGGKKSTFAALQLTPLIDMFIVMVIFLLMSFSATGEIGTASKDIKLPFAAKVENLERAPIIAISQPEADPERGVITLEGAEVARANELMADEGPDWKIVRLVENLETYKANWKQTHPNQDFKGELILTVDENVDFKVIKKVMYSAGVAGYTNLMFAVRRQEKQGES
ncbi:MAG: MotA/TolQ/ExbB proton channel family protein [Deltaproteobacteria bacterium]|nr:MotA/TolQ/ExbB proton channel family protein [Deltaproteobacteria bacterium]